MRPDTLTVTRPPGVRAPFTERDLASSRFRALGSGTPRLERATTVGGASWLVAGRGEVAPATLAALQREYAFRQALHAAWAAMPVALLPHGEGAVLVLQDPGGELLQHGDTPPPHDTQAFLSLAVQLTTTVAAMHAAGVVHLALTPRRWLRRGDAGACLLTGFGQAARLEPANHHRLDGGATAWDEDSFAYMAPELGARMNLEVDARADLYALGCILYELLAGAPPFRGEDAAQLVHAHATQAPPPPGERREGVPAQLSRVVMKLLEKAPAQRYRDAESLLADLRRCDALQRAHGAIRAFALDAQASLRRLPGAQHALLGREREVQALVARYGEAAHHGAARAVWVLGPSGIGKSILLREAIARIQQRSAPLLATAKGEEAGLGRPYAVLAQALEQLLRSVLGAPEDEFAIWRDRIRDATAGVDRILAAIVPALATVLGSHADGAPAEGAGVGEAPDAAPALERERVLQGLARLLACFATPARPLLMVLDDLQWADAGTQQVLERLLRQHADHKPLLLVGTFRCEVGDGEVGDGGEPLRDGPLARLPATRMALGPLDEGALRELIAQALQQEAHTLGPLAEVIGRKTRRNPFFARHLLGVLADDGLLAYDAAAGAWRWSLERIDAHPGVDTVHDLLARRFLQLPAPAQAAVRLLACLGHRTSDEALAVAAGRTPGRPAREALEAALAPAVQAGSVRREEGGWVFCHDRFREAAYASLPHDARAWLHLQIARRQMRHPATSGQVLHVAAQASLARPAVRTASERRAFAALALEAGRQAKAATAHHAALGHFRVALDFLGEDDTSEDGLQARALCGEAEFMTGELAAAEARLSALERVAGDGIFGADLARLRAALYTTLGRFDLALGAGLQFLARSGIHVPMQPDDAAVDREFAQLKAWLARHGVEALRRLPVAREPLRRAIDNIFADLIPPALYTDRNLVDLILLRMANLGIRHGHTDATADGYVCMTQVFGVRYGDYATARAFGALALHLVDERALARYRGRVYMTYGTMVVPWTERARAARGYIRRAYDVLVQAADHTFAIYCGANEASGMLFAGEFLGEVRETVDRALVLARDANFQLVVNALLAQRLLLARLQDGSGAPLDALPPVPADGTPATLVDFEYWVYRLEAALIFGEMPEALEARERAEACAGAGRTFAESGELPFYGALALLALPERSASQEASLQRDAAQLAAWARACPENFSARAELVHAERARAGGDALEASAAYARAVSLARRHGLPQVEALAAERAACFHAGRGDEPSAHGHLRHARGAWQRWGAAAKVRALQAAHPAVFEPDDWAPAASRRLETLDAQAVLRIASALASDIVPARLVETLLRTALESAGAASGTLALLRHGHWQVRASARVLDGVISVSQEAGALDAAALPLSIVQLVARTQQRMVVGDAREEPSLALDDYVRRQRPRSVLCVPLMRHASLIGVLYLENSLAAQVFTLAKAEVLEVVASQAAFALENARLYEELLAQNQQRALAEERLRGALAELERASRLKAMGELAASIVHEIGQPIAAVDTSASAALRWLDRGTPEIAEAREMLSHIRQSALRARHIIQGLRAKARNAEPQFAPFDMAEALREAATLVAGPLDAMGVTLDLQGLDAPVPAHGDRVQLQQVAVNLLTNGAEAMAEVARGDRRLHLACAVAPDGGIRVTVDDRGAGIAPEAAAQLLQPLYTTKANGMGMGLAICKSILDAHGGTLALAPRDGAGMRAVFTLPARAA